MAVGAKRKLRLSQVAVSALGIALATSPNIAVAQEAGAAPWAAAPTPTPPAAEQMPIDPETGKPFPTLAEVSARTPPLRAMTQEEETRWQQLQKSFVELLSAQKLPEAIRQAEAILELEERTLGPMHPEVLGTLSALTQLRAAQGQFAQAEPFARRALELSQALLGERHPDTLQILSNYAGVLQTLGRAAEAEPHYAEALQLFREVLGERHPDTLTSLNNYAFVLNALGRAGEAEPLYAEALRLRREVLGDRHPDTLSNLNNYAYVLNSLGRAAEAEPFYADALRLFREVLGERHPATLTSLNNYAAVLEALGRAAEAEPLYAKALRLRREVLGERHPDTLLSLNNYAGVLNALGRVAEAEPLYANALRLYREVLGERNPETLSSLNNYAFVLRALSRAAEAEPLYAEALRLRREVLGERHPDTLTSLNNYAAVLNELGRTAEAEPRFAEALQLFREVLGERHPDTLGSTNNYAYVLFTLSRTIEAEQRFADALRLRREVLGERHPDTLESLNNYAIVIQALDRAAEAEPLLAEALWLYREVLGERHPDTVRGAENLAFNRLLLPTLASQSLDPARLALGTLRTRFAQSGEGGARGELQQERDRAGLQWTERLFADAAWARGAAVPAEAEPLRGEAFGALQNAGAGSAAQAIAQTAARRYADRVGAGDLVDERASLVQNWASTERDLLGVEASGQPQPQVLERLRGQLTEIETRIRAIDAELKDKAPQYFAIVNQPALSVAEAQAMLAEDEAVLIVVPSQFGTHVMALTRTELVWHRADIKAGEVAAKVARLREDLNPGEGRGPDKTIARQPARLSFDRATAHDLYTALIAPVAATLEGKTHLFIAADGALASLPFGVLVTEAPQAGSDGSDPEVLRATPWFADAYALVQIPSLQSLAYLRRFNTGEGEASGSPGISTPTRRTGTTTTTLASASGSGFAGFGDPVLDGAAKTRGARTVEPVKLVDATTLRGTGVGEAGTPLMNPAQLRALARLPGTRTELTAIGTLLGVPEGAIRLDKAMTETALRKADLSNVRILQLATHGLTASEAGQRGGRTEPGLVFTPPAEATSQDDGYLAASEVLTLNLTAIDWVILSACNTAAPSGTPGEPGLSGLARAFFYAGAPSLLVSHWPVFDDVAATLTVNTLRRTQAGESRATALQSAMRDIRNTPGNPRFAHPSAWAPFTIAGEGR